MSILQLASASNAIINEGQKFYRINQPALGNGDIFEVDQSVKAIVVGPLSDFAEYSVYYYDPITDLAVNLATISSDQPFIGDLLVRLDQQYRGARGLSGKIIVTTKDLYIPTAFAGAIAPSTSDIFPPNIDLLFYTTPPNTIPDKRPSRVIRTAISAAAAVAVHSFHFPSYGRRIISISLVDASSAIAASLSVSGTNFAYPSGDFYSDTVPMIATLGGTTAMTPGGISGMTYNAETPAAIAGGGTRGYWDYITANIISDFDINPPTSVRGDLQIFFSAKD
ncbi:MAG: hypothetical protein Q8S00_32360 [Deltaproteobacteria bacterium]|nr:hypothetical protein [Deltaproteobacteria bacterium]